MSSPKEFELVRRWIPWLLGFVGGLLLFQGAEDPELMAAREHMAATYLGLAMTAGLFSPKLLWRLAWIGVGIAGIYYSGSRGALLSLPVALAGYGVFLLLSRRTKDAVTLLALAAVVGTVFLSPSLRDAFFAKKKRRYSSGYESLEGGFEQRLYLTEEAWAIARENPLGTGAGPTYRIGYQDKTLGAHNGYLDTLVQLGFPATLLLFGWYGYLLFKALGNPNFPLESKCMFATYAVVLHVRALGESYSVFDAASFFVFLLWYMTWYGAYDAKAAKRLPARRRGPIGKRRGWRTARSDRRMSGRLALVRDR